MWYFQSRLVIKHQLISQTYTYTASDGHIFLWNYRFECLIQCYRFTDDYCLRISSSSTYKITEWNLWLILHLHIKSQEPFSNVPDIHCYGFTYKYNILHKGIPALQGVVHLLQHERYTNPSAAELLLLVIYKELLLNTSGRSMVTNLWWKIIV